ncbi:hypothetical protein PUN28_009687 [Cardiocondyla obscurior]|uniref:Uncharacterized protein n=1 Tax=Cardiocondyla obscurior TaxID=286306 RepID=A0AAW2FVE4_9HYME
MRYAKVKRTDGEIHGNRLRHPEDDKRTNDIDSRSIDTSPLQSASAGSQRRRRASKNNEASTHRRFNLHLPVAKDVAEHRKITKEIRGDRLRHPEDDKRTNDIDSRSIDTSLLQSAPASSRGLAIFNPVRGRKERPRLRGGGGLGKASCFGGTTFRIVVAALL